MLARLSNSLILQPSDITPSQPDWEVIGVFNPGAAVVDDTPLILARVAERPSEQRPGWTGLPRYLPCGTASIDWFRDSELKATDPRVVAIRSTGELRLTSVSHLRLFRLSENADGAWIAADVIMPAGLSEEFGIEDPRITRIDGTYWITYIVVSRAGAATALMSSNDMVSFRRHGIIFPAENKDVVLFPTAINGDYVALHRPNPRSHFTPPRIWIARSPDLLHWGRHEPILSGQTAWEGDRVGSGTPPILIEEGWLMLYHGSQVSKVAGQVGCYSAGAVLLDRDDPSRIIARSTAPLMIPFASYETKGFVPNVVFPTGVFCSLGERCADDRLQVLYGAADTSVAMVEFSTRSILQSLTEVNN